MPDIRPIFDIDIRSGKPHCQGSTGLSQVQKARVGEDMETLNCSWVCVCKRVLITTEHQTANTVAARLVQLATWGTVGGKQNGLKAFFQLAAKMNLCVCACVWHRESLTHAKGNSQSRKILHNSGLLHSWKFRCDITLFSFLKLYHRCS